MATSPAGGGGLEVRVVEESAGEAVVGELTKEWEVEVEAEAEGDRGGGEKKRAFLGAAWEGELGWEEASSHWGDRAPKWSAAAGAGGWPKENWASWTVGVVVGPSVGQ
jgi:hypothetical protein